MRSGALRAVPFVGIVLLAAGSLALDTPWEEVAIAAGFALAVTSWLLRRR